MPEIRINLPDDLYREYLQRSRAEGYRSVEEYIVRVLEKSIRERVHDEIARLERRLMDLVNKYTSKVDELAQRTGELREMIDELRSRYEELEKSVEDLRRALERGGVRERREETVKTGEERARKTAIEVLREQKVIYESSIASRIRDRDSFFKRLERDGAKILYLKNERVAVDPDFWREFLDKLASIHDDSIEAVKKALSKEEYRLFERLKASDMMIYSAVNRRWEVHET